MFKIWAKVIIDNKILKHAIFEFEGVFKKNSMMDYIFNICDELDIPSPIVLNPHIKNFNQYNIVKFGSSDFIDEIDFDWLTLEYCKEEEHTQDFKGH